MTDVDTSQPTPTPSSGYRGGFDFHWIGGETRRRIRVDEVIGATHCGTVSFRAERDRRFFRRLAALILAVVGCAALIAMIGRLTGLIPHGNVSAVSMSVFLLGAVGSIVASWLLAMYFMPGRAVSLYFNEEDLDPSLFVAPARRYHFGRRTFTVLDRELRTLGYLREESDEMFEWSILNSESEALLRIERQPGAPAYGILLSLLLPVLITLAVFLAFATRPRRPVAVVTADAKYQVGVLAASGGIRGDMSIDMSGDPRLYFDRSLVLAASVLLAMEA